MKTKATVLKITINTWKSPSRDLRELSVIKDLGANILVIAKSFGKDFSVGIEQPHGYVVHRLPTNSKKGIFKAVGRVSTLIFWLSYVRKIDADILSCHDLVALLIGYLSTIGKRKQKRTALVYDSHEFELGRTSNRGIIASTIVKYLERYLIKRCSFSIMVNDSIAEEVMRIHKLQTKPVVVRNIPAYFHLNQQDIILQRQCFLKRLRMHEDTFLVMYHGGIMPNRGIENTLHAIADLDDTAAIIMGNFVNDDYQQELQEKMRHLNLESRVLIHESVPLNSLGTYVGAVDAEMIIVPAVSKSYYYMLPNKFFESIQSLTPVIVSDFPEISKLTNEYQIGLVVNPMDVEAIRRAIIDMKNDKKRYSEYKENLMIAKEIFCWENEKTILEEKYRALLEGNIV